MLAFIRKRETITPKKNTFLKILGTCLPYLLILIASFLPFVSYLVTGDNLPNGTDVLWHRLWSWDLSEGWRNGFFGVTPSHTLMGNLGVGTYLFYGPLSHFLVAFIHLICPFISIGMSWKIVTIALTFLMGVWMFKLGKKLCKNEICALMISICLIFSPYRVNCILYRGAYPEALAISFYPLLFLGVYDLANKDYRPQAFLSCVFGVSCLLLCHPFTAMIGIIAAFVYLLCHYKGFIGIFTNKRALIYTVSSVVIVFCLVSFYIFPMLHYSNSGLYNISNSSLMWTNVEHIIDSMRESGLFSGFLRPDWTSEIAPNYNFPNIYNESWLSWSLDYVYFAFFGSLSIFLMCFLEKKEKPFIGSICASLVSLLPLIWCRRPEVFLIIPLFSISIFVIGTSQKEKYEWLESKREIIEEAKSPALYWCLLLFVLCFLFIYWGQIWHIVPKIFLQGQFAWRFWSLLFFIAAILLCYIVRPFGKKKYVQGSLALLFGICYLSCMGIIDKRFCLQAGEGSVSEPNISMAKTIRNQGSQNEYTPACFRDSNYVSKYSNSLYKEIRAEIYTRSGISYQWGMEKYLSPVFLEGDGDMEITYLNSPEAEFNLTVLTSQTLVQLPQFYYEGYDLVLSGDSSYTVSCVNVDGLISFNLKEGTYKASLKWVGLKSYRIGVPLFFVGLFGSAGLYFVPFFIDKRKEKQKDAE